MSFEIIALIFSLVGFCGIFAIVLRKIPTLVSLPEVSPLNENVFLALKGKLGSISPLKVFSFEIILQKVLSQVRILSLKTDTKTFHWLKAIREKSKKRNLENDNYWEEIKNSTKNGK